MDCRDFQSKLIELTEGRLPAAERLAAERHGARCPRCRELWDSMRSEPELPAVDPPADLAGSILQRTSGSACGRAREILCGHADGELDDLDRELLELHAEGCGDCASLAVALRHLADDLPAMATLTPDARFVDDVLAATAPSSAPAAGLAARLAEGWSRLLQRPRFAWEFGYVGAMALWLVFGSVFSPLRAAPSRAVSMLRSSPVAIDGVKTQVSILGQQAWESTGGKGLGSLSLLKDDLTVRYDRARPATRDLLERTEKTLRDVGADAHTLWTSFVTNLEQDEDVQPR